MRFVPHSVRSLRTPHTDNGPRATPGPYCQPVAVRDSPETLRPGPRWFAWLAVGLVACLSQILLPVGGAAWGAAFFVANLAAAAVLVAATVRMPPGVRAIWGLTSMFVVATLLADLVYRVQTDVLGVDAFPGPADLLYMTAYIFAVIALARASRRMATSSDRDALIDTGIVTIALLAAATVLLFEPIVEATTDFDLAFYAAMAYPVLDILLVAALVRLLLGVRRLPLPLVLVTLAFTALLAADLIYQFMTAFGESDSATGLSEALYLATPVLLAAAATAPGATVIAAPVSQTLQRPTSVRVVALTIGVVTTPVLLLVVIWPDDRPIERLLAAATVVVILLALLRIQRLLATVESQAEQLGRQARTDALTGLPNRRTLDYEVERTVQQAVSDGQSLTVAMLDLDRFKSFNDEFGHQAGDALLRGAAQAWTKALPPGSFLARYGGEEFALLLPGVGGETAERLLEGLRAITPPERTVSIGFAEWQPDESGYEALNRADRALYAAKAAGRDRVVRDNPDADQVSAAGRSPDRR